MPTAAHDASDDLIPIRFDDDSIVYMPPTTRVSVGGIDVPLSLVILDARGGSTSLLFADGRAGTILGWKDEALWLRRLHGIGVGAAPRAPVDLTAVESFAKASLALPEKLLAKTALVLVGECRRILGNAHEALAELFELEPAHTEDNDRRDRAIAALRDALCGGDEPIETLAIALRAVRQAAAAWRVAHRAHFRGTIQDEPELWRARDAAADRLQGAASHLLTLPDLDREQLGRIVHEARSRGWIQRGRATAVEPWEDLSAALRAIDCDLGAEVASYILGRSSVDLGALVSQVLAALENEDPGMAPEVRAAALTTRLLELFWLPVPEAP